MNNQKEVEDTVAWFEFNLRTGCFEQVNNILDNIDLTTLQAASILGILGLTYYAKGKLPGRPKFLERAEVVLKQNLGEERAERLLKNRR